MESTSTEIAVIQSAPSVGAQMKEMLSPATNVAASVQIAAQQAAIQIACQVMAAQATPRNEVDIMREFIIRAQDLDFAETAFYAVPRGNRDDDASDSKKTDDDKKVRGPSVHLAREILARWQHLNVEVCDHGKFSSVIGGKTETYSDVEIQAWDIQNNSRFTTKFKVRHWRHTKSGGYAVQGNQVDEIVGAASAKRERNAILKFVPRSFIVGLQKVCDATIAASMQKQETLNKMLAFFSGAGVTQAQLEAYVGKAFAQWDSEDRVHMAGIVVALKTREATVEDYFGAQTQVSTSISQPPPAKPVDKPPASNGTKAETKKSESKPASSKPADKKPDKKPDATAPVGLHIAYLEEGSHIYGIGKNGETAALDGQKCFKEDIELNTVLASEKLGEYVGAHGGDSKRMADGGLGWKIKSGEHGEVAELVKVAQPKPAEQKQEKTASLDAGDDILFTM